MGPVSSPRPDLSQLQQQPRKLRHGLQLGNLLQPQRGTTCGPHLHGLFVGLQQPAQPGTIGLLGGHLLAQCRHAPRALVSGAGQFHHQFGAERRETAAFDRAEGLPAIQANHGDIGTEDRTGGQAKAARGAAHLPAALLIGPKQQTQLEPRIACFGFTTSWRHRNDMAICCQLQHCLAVLAAHPFELLGVRRRSGGNRHGDRADGEGHLPRPAAESFRVAAVAREPLSRARSPFRTPPNTAPPPAPEPRAARLAP